MSKVLWLCLFHLFVFFLTMTSGDKDNPARDCVDLLEKGFKQDGVYLINPDNNGSFYVLCDQTTNGGGWVVFQKRFNGSEDFFRNWSDYKSGFGKLNGEFWLGNDKIHRLTNRYQQLLIELEDFDNYTAHAQYEPFSIDSEEELYKLHLDSYSGTAGNSLGPHNNMNFSTRDQDNDKHVRSCAHLLSSAWWYRGCGFSNLNGDYFAPAKVYWRKMKGYDYSLKATSMKMRSVSGKEWDYSIGLQNNDGFAHAQLVVKLSELNKLTACWWMKLMTTEDKQDITVLSFDEASLNASFAFSIRRNSTFRFTLNATHDDFYLPEVTLHVDTRWRHMCVTGKFSIGNWFYYVDGKLKLQNTGRQGNLETHAGSVLRIGVLSGNSSDGKNKLIGELSQFNIWDEILTPDNILFKSRGCHAHMGNVISWSVVQLWLHDNVTKTSPSSCTGADNIHWTLSSADGHNITDGSTSWQGHVIGDGVTMDTKVMSLQGGGHVILGSFDNNCPGNPAICHDGYSVSFWIKDGVKFTSFILGQNEKYHQVLESMVSAVTPNNSKWTRCYHAKTDGFTAHDFHSGCDNKGPTITLVQVREFVFGGFLDQNWGGPQIRNISSLSAFLFSLNNVLGLEPFKMDIKKKERWAAAKHDPTKGPMFGLDDLTIGFDSSAIPRQSTSIIGGAYNLPEGYNITEKAGFGVFAETNLFTWDDLEVFHYDVPHRALGLADPGVVPDSAFASSSERISLNYSAPKALQPKNSEGEWCAHYKDTQQWLQANLSHSKQHGRLRIELFKAYSEESWVISYHVNTSMDGQRWTLSREDDKSLIPLQENANYIRIIPKSWKSNICMKIDIQSVGHPVVINKMTASSERCMSPAHFARLHFPGLCFSAWCTKLRSEDKYPWLRVHLGAEYYILFVATQGSGNEPNQYFVFKYKLRYKGTKKWWVTVKEKGEDKQFHGNWDGSTAVKNAILNPFKTHKLEFKPTYDNGLQYDRPFGFCLRVEIYVPVDDQNTIISWRTKETSNAKKRDFEYKQVNDLFTSYHQLSVAWENKIQKLNIPTVPREWHYVTFTWSRSWGLKFYQNGVLVKETGRVLEREYPETNATDGLLIIGNRSLSDGVKLVDNFQIHGLTMWPRLVSQAQIKEMLDTVACRMIDGCLRNSNEDDFDWLHGSSCTKTWYTGPCSDPISTDQVQRTFISGAFKGTTEQQPAGSSWSAVDGQIDTRTSVGQAPNPWLKVDLGREGLVIGVRISLDVQIFNSGPGILRIKVIDKNAKLHLCAKIVVSEDMVGWNLVGYCDKPLPGRYVRVAMSVSGFCGISSCEYTMYLNELEVMLDQSTGFLYVEALGQYKGDKTRLETQFILPKYSCLKFSYHMEGRQMGKLSVYSKSYQGGETLLWRLFGAQSNEWQHAQISIDSSKIFQVIFEETIGDGPEGDAAIDEVKFTRDNNCSITPDNARPMYYGGDFRSAIIGHMLGYKARLESWLTSVNFQGRLWKPCYSGARDGWDSGIFHQKCDGKGATLTVARANNTIFGGFTDHSWGGSFEGYQVTTKSFLFRFERTLGQAFKELVLGIAKVSKRIKWNKDRGPIFGLEELGLSSNMREATTSSLVFYADNRTNETSLLKENDTYVHDIEVLVIGDTTCASQCPLYQFCDEILGKCAWDLTLVDAHFCDPGNPRFYWPLDNHFNLVNLGGDLWGTFTGNVSTTHGARLGAAYTGSGSVINLGEVMDSCFTHPLSCDSGFTVSLWLKHRTIYLSDVTVAQEFVTIGNTNSFSFIFSLFQFGQRTEEHLAVRVAASSRSCVYIFSVPRSLMSHFSFVWNTTDLQIFRNGLKVNEFLNEGELCAEETQINVQLPVVTLSGEAVFDDLKIWNRKLQPNEIDEMYSCVRAPSWTCKTSDWSKSMQTSGWSECSEHNTLMNGLQRGENGGLEDFLDRLQGALCCSPPPLYKHQSLKCYKTGYHKNGENGVLQCSYYYFLRGLNRRSGKQATLDFLKYGRCCRLNDQPHYAKCYDHPVSPFDKPGLFMCQDHYYITGIYTRNCHQLNCIDKFRCCLMKTDVQSKRVLEISVTASLLKENWHPRMANETLYEFKSLKNRIQKGVWGVYTDNEKPFLIDRVAVNKFRPGSVLAYFSIIFNSPYYEMITPLVEAINQTVSPDEVNYLGDMAIQLWNVEPRNVYGKSLNANVSAINSSSLYVNWEYAEDAPQFGFFQGYQVLFRKGNNSEGFLLGAEIDGNSTQAWLPAEECELYSFKLRAFSLEGYGKLSEAVTMETSCKAVSNVTAIGVNSSSIFVQWSPSKGSLVTGYNVAYALVRGGATMHVALQRNVSRVHLVHLSGFTTYRIKVGLMKNGDATFWSEEVLASGLQGAPSAPPENVTGHNLSSTSVMVTWLPVADDLLNGILQSYRVLYREASDGNSPATEIVMGNSSLSVVILSLKKFTMYSVWVKAVTVRAGPSSAVINVSTDEDVPSFLPLGVTAFNISSTIIRVLWQPAPADRVHGVLLGYHVEYHKVNRAKRSVTLVTVNETSLSVDIRDLQKFSEYMILVSGFNSKGDGNQTEIRCWTDEDIPDSPPTNITTRTDNSTALAVFWDPVRHEDQNGIILGYRVSLFDALGNSLRNVTVQNSSQSSYQFHALDVWTNYSVKVCAFTSRGNGPYRSSLHANTDEDVPLVAPAGITGHNTSSTSIRVAWQPVSSDDVNIRGIHRGYRVYYKPIKTSRPSVLMNVTVDVYTTHLQLTNLYKFTKYVMYVVVVTRWDGLLSPVIIVSTDEGDLPPADITAKTLGMTGITVQWAPVSLGFRGGIIRGYKITYNSSNSATRWINASHDASYVTLTSLTKFNFYDVYVQAFTIKGDGPAYHLLTATDMGVPTEEPPGLTAEDWGTNHSIIVKWQPLPPSNEYGILSGYRIRYQLTRIGEEIIADQSIKELIVDSSTNQVLLDNLEMYGTYSIWLSAFTIKGNGPESFTSGETCRCEKHLRTNWRKFPPYVSNVSNWDTPHPGGILPGLVQDMAVTCCETCQSHGQSVVDFNLDGDGQPSRKSSDSALRASISQRTHFSFPIPGYTGQERYGADFGYWPLIQTPGVAYIVNTNTGTSPSSVLNNTLASCWPAALLVFVTSLLAGFLMWILDGRANQSQFPPSVTRGAGEGFWWAFVTMTTVGYGDKYAVTPAARILTGIWMLTGLIIQGMFVATVTMSLVSQSLDVDFKLYGSETAAIQDSFEYRFGLRRNARLNPDKQYTTYEEISTALLDGDVTGALIDTYVLGSRKDLFEKPSLRLMEIHDYSTAYGVVLGGESKKLRRCFRRYMQRHSKKIFQTVEKHVDHVKEPSLPLAVERSTGLVDSEGPMYKTVIFLSSVLLVVFLVVGAIWELVKRLKRRRRVLTECDLRRNTRREISEAVEDFAAGISALAEKLKIKHSKERLHLIKTLKSASRTKEKDRGLHEFDTAL